mmetsp:Transcript_35573/g.100162  ORF Transcript_35573/g.100162 Transcript_35573/m.100162 type:complete len:140 (-) Transcript_35573:1350-1769(-)
MQHLRKVGDLLVADIKDAGCPSVGRNTKALVAVDAFSGRYFLVPIQSTKQTATAITRICETILAETGLHTRALAVDADPHFTSQAFRASIKALGIRLSCAPGGEHEFVGLAERAIQTIWGMTKCLLAQVTGDARDVGRL